METWWIWSDGSASQGFAKREDAASRRLREAADRPQQWPVSAAEAICRINQQDVFLWRASYSYPACKGLHEGWTRVRLQWQMKWALSFLQHPLPVFSLFGRLMALGWKKLLHRGMKEDLSRCHCLLLILFQALTMRLCPAWKKLKCVPSAIVSSNRHQQANFSVLPYRWTHSWENVFFFLSLVSTMASPFFPEPKGISRASATPAVTVLSTSHLSSGPLMWLIHSLWSKWFWRVDRRAVW